jgi:hypothetical protein
LPDTSAELPCSLAVVRGCQAESPDQIDRRARLENAPSRDLIVVDLLSHLPTAEVENRWFRVFDDAFVLRVGKALTAGLRAQGILCATVALSPDTTGGWKKA